MKITIPDDKVDHVMSVLGEIDLAQGEILHKTHRGRKLTKETK